MENEAPKQKLVDFFRHPVIRQIIILIAIFSAVYFAFTFALMAIFRTNTPLLAVCSDSMKHYDNTWETYFLERGVNPSSFPFQNGFERGDLIIVQGADVRDIAVGDVIVFQVPEKGQFTHRVVEKVENNGSYSFMTKGDANLWPLLFEYSIKPEQIMGKVVCVVPKLGHLWLWLTGK